METDSGSFFVSGVSERVADFNLRVYILIYPVEPHGGGWWIQPSVVMKSDGSWSGRAWIGCSGYPPHVGDTLNIQAIVTTPERVKNRPMVDDPDDLKPGAKSNIVSLTIGSIST